MVILSSSERTVTVLTMLVVWEQLLMGDFTCSCTDLFISTFNVFQTEHKQLLLNIHMLSTWPTMCRCACNYSNLEPRSMGQYQTCSYGNLEPRLGQYQNNNSCSYSNLEPRSRWVWDNTRTITPIAKQPGAQEVGTTPGQSISTTCWWSGDSSTPQCLPSLHVLFLLMHHSCHEIIPAVPSMDIMWGWILTTPPPIRMVYFVCYIW